MRGVVRCGINNIFTVAADGIELECRIKGKKLREEFPAYNPIAVGDIVTFQPDPYSPRQGTITALEERRNAFVRWIKKKKSVQTIASNVDFLVIVSSVASPPFRPRFIDRMIVAGLSGGVEPLIVLNKCDLGGAESMRERMEGFRACGYTILRVSAQTGQGIAELKKLISGKTSVFAGQSGVGKSSLLNAISPGLQRRVGEISAKYGRGIHTTSFAVMICIDESSSVIDTPGIRELDIASVPPEELKFYFPEFGELLPQCAYPSCLHNREPDCAVKQAVEKSEVLYDRYESYLRILYDLEQRKACAYD
jgi:ribosome biogenesis GTPase